MARLAAIDIGSNAIRLRIVDADAPTESPSGGLQFQTFREVYAERASVRLGHDVFTKGRIEANMLGEACEALRRFRDVMDQVKVDRYRAVATSACREAKNADVFVERAEREAGVFVEVIEGVEEARLVQEAVRQRLGLTDRTALLIDIGGGSTELTVMSRGRATFARSLSIGTVRFVEAFLQSAGRVDSVRQELIDEMIERVTGDTLHELSLAAGGSLDALVATGGNIETLAELAPEHGAPIPTIAVPQLSALWNVLANLTVAERGSRFSLRADRADTIIPATRILLRIASHFQAQSIVAPGVGLKEGILVDLATAHFVPRDFTMEAASVGEACIRLGQRYHFDERHGRTVARFATQLFDDLGKLHGLEPRDRVLLFASALLHDVGDFIRYEGHHKHSYYIILHSDLMGLTPSEREIVANVARYHRKTPPSLEHENFRQLTREVRAKVKVMAAILRVADALDREHRQVVTNVTGRVESGFFMLELEGTEDRALEEWTLRAKNGMLRETLGLDVRLRNATTSTPPREAAE